MKSRRTTSCIAIILILSLNYQFIDPGKAQIELNVPKIDTEVQYTLKIVFLGFNPSRIDITLLEDKLMSEHAPIPFWVVYGHGRLPWIYDDLLRYRYMINYDFEFVNDQRYNDFLEFVNEISTIEEGPEFSDYNDTQYIPTELIEKYLVDSGITQPYQPTLVIMDLYTNNPSNHQPHYYRITTKDWDSIAQFKIADGGWKSETLWLDLSAGPTQYLTGTEGEITNNSVPPIWNYNDTNNDELYDALSTYIQTSIELKFIPSSPFTPLCTFNDIEIRMKVLSTEDGRSLSLFDEKFFNSIIDQLQQYNPFVTYTISMVDFDPDEDETQELLDEVKKTYNPQTNSYNYRLFSPQYLINKYTEHFGLDDVKSGKVVIPVYTFNTGSKNVGANGLASNDASGEFTYIIHKPFSRYDGGLLSDHDFLVHANTKLLAHEISHALGLSHPFDGFTHNHYQDRSARYFKYWLWDYSSSMMSYLALLNNASTIDITTIRQNYLGQFHYSYNESINWFNLNIEEIPRWYQENIETQIQESFTHFENSLKSFQGGYMDMYYTSLKEMYEADKIITEIESDINNILQGDKIVLEVWQIASLSVGGMGLLLIMLLMVKKRLIKGLDS